ncbi:MAG: DNA polymerase I [Bacteroidales bacterium]|nr:DNA polymerase I [Candidatus Colimorpha onthohippi]
MRKLILIDGMALTYRSFYAMGRSGRTNSKGLNTAASLGFVTTLYDLIRSQQPTHIAVAFDLPEPTFRHQLYADYKANRDAMPEDIATALPYIHKLVGAFNIPIITCSGYEADDVIGTISYQAEQLGFDQILMVTPDKDFAQLVTDRILMYRFGRAGSPDELMGVNEVKSKFGVSDCCQVADLLGLWGDASDNIPGVKGVGEKSAKKLIAQFGSVEQMVLRVEEIKNDKVRALVRDNANQALFSKKLATIVKDAPISFSEEQLRLTEPNYSQLSALFKELEFRALSKRLFTDLSISNPDKALLFSASASSKRIQQPDTAQLSLFDIPVDVNSEPDQSNEQESLLQISLLPDLPSSGDVAIYINGATLAVAVDAEHVFVSTVGETNLSLLKKLLQDDTTTKLCHDIKLLKYMLKELDIEIKGEIFDLQLAHYLVDSEARHTIGFISSSILGYEPDSPQEMAAVMWQIFPCLAARLSDANLYGIYRDIELPLVDVLISMEQEGVNIDVQAIRDYSAHLTVERGQLEQQIYELAGMSFNISSPKQLGEVLYDRLKVTDKPPRTATKQYSTAEDVLQKLSSKHPIIDKILEYRSLSKLIGTYLDSFPKLINPTTGRLHTIYNQAVTATGRLSSSSPNLQNIPIRTERGREIRKAFIPRNDQYTLLAADYSQIELRIIASLSGDKNMMHSFVENQDIHAATAAKIYKTSIGEVSKEQRRNAKSVNFGTVYGISAFGLSEQLHIPRQEAKDLIDQYFEQYPDIQKYIEKSIAFAREHGYANTILGRRRYLSDINSRNNNLRGFAERNAVNMPIQGSSADMIKVAMCRIYHRFLELNLRSKMILQVHDELVFDVYKPEIDVVKQIVESEMRQALPLDIPVQVSIEIGQNWLEAH